MKLILNNTDIDHHQFLKRHFETADRVRISVAYLKKTGLTLLRPLLEAALARGTKVEMFCGLDFYLTDPDAVQDVYDLFIGKRATLYLCEIAKVNFHPKVYCFWSNRRTTAVVGSANLSRGGLQTNIELSGVETVSADSDLTREIDAYFEKLKRLTGVEPADAPGILRYQARAEIYRKHLRDAEREARKEIKARPDWNAKRLRLWLDRYRKDKTKQTEMERRIKGYKEAKRLLDQLAAGKNISKAQFISVYVKLVGGKGIGSLWSSDQLYRQKSNVARNYKHALSMFAAVKKLIGHSPELVFEEGMKYVKRVKGLGPNVLTEAMHTWDPARYAVLNNNPVTSLKELGRQFPNPQSFRSATYGSYNQTMRMLAQWCSFKSLAQVDKFLNYIYWKQKNDKRKK